MLKTQHLLDKTDFRRMADHLDLFQHTHETMEKGASWNSFTMKEGSKVEAVVFSRQEDRKVKHKVVSSSAIRASERIEEAAEKMERRTIVQVAKVLLDDATIKHAETTAAVKAVRATCSLVQTGQIIFDVGGNLIEECDKNTKRTEIRIKENTEETRKRTLDDENFVSHRHFTPEFCIFSYSHFSRDLSKRDVFQIGCKVQKDGSACTDPAMSELW